MMCITCVRVSSVGYDYTEITGNITLYPGDELACEYFDTILDDNILEDQETFAVSIYQLGSTSRANFIRSYSTVTIVDNESKMQVCSICIC